MSSDYWKALERREASRYWRGKRILRGNDYSLELPDGESPLEVWDAKCRKTFAVLSGRSMFRESEKKYATYTGNRRFHMVIHEYSKEGDFVVCRADDYAQLVRDATRNDLLEELQP